MGEGGTVRKEQRERRGREDGENALIAVLTHVGSLDVDRADSAVSHSFTRSRFVRLEERSE